VTNILLIGHEGYLGRGLHSYLSRKHRVVGWDKKEDLFKLDPAVLARERIEMLINLAVMADRGTGAFQLDTPGDHVNVCGVRHIARILKGTGISWIQMSTREVFGPVYKAGDVTKTKNGLRPKWLVPEEQPYAPTNPYGKSKVMSEFLSESHAESAVIRLTTCYTDYDHPAGNWVVSLIRAAVQGKPVNLTRGGEQFRDPLHVDDLGRLMELIHEKKAFGQKFNAGGGRKNLISLKDFMRVADPRVKLSRAPGGDYGFAFDVRKAAKLTGWQPKILVRDRIPVIADNIRRGIAAPPRIA
jgi:nucleoside-diphosphate-sugar epimerase